MLMNSNKFEFLKYELTPGEKHLGIATVKLYGKMLAKYKIVPTKDGSAFFPAAPSIKIGDKYESCIMLDSNSDKQELDTLIKANVAGNRSEPQVAPPIPKYEQTTFLDGCPF